MFGSHLLYSTGTSDVARLSVFKISKIPCQGNQPHVFPAKQNMFPGITFSFFQLICHSTYTSFGYWTFYLFIILKINTIRKHPKWLFGNLKPIPHATVTPYSLKASPRKRELVENTSSSTVANSYLHTSNSCRSCFHSSCRKVCALLPLNSHYAWKLWSSLESIGHPRYGWKDSERIIVEKGPKVQFDIRQGLMRLSISRSGGATCGQVLSVWGSQMPSWSLEKTINKKLEKDLFFNWYI